ncbi:hypothetical protein COU15_01835 [Candidatus Kaiserbacteria bacterium CG10_big_fil_rev_8_21_14_0_10_45_20]|uniref:Uncharacterized protein n=1 Tax=Candidatus Kaiserbacteria bacterium CG10_big_fil_rev_8_21_14_0_10_45_20 TaxID=1974607 RepID=A0A2H0UFD8_9BACT|nr:MAG: hypothetical protein COU15_01835 [Candidatus Kaiserbacteria bacterium CG10_big_fil_rev_8_21_14_0_10_45_20]
MSEKRSFLSGGSLDLGEVSCRILAERKERMPEPNSGQLSVGEPTSLPTLSQNKPASSNAKVEYIYLEDVVDRYLRDKTH